ncbi:MAG: type II toxin-antitoxin system YoeB family toxin [Lachnospiraceae bacterium]|nr:type II toxin-antitoxin system YoeB family toxin [Lachnospiraceae bacterium]
MRNILRKPLKDLNKKTLKKINRLIKYLMGTPYTGFGKPEPLKYILSCYCGRSL